MKGYKRKRGGAWRLEVSAGVNPETGKYRRVTETFKGSAREADERLRELVREVEGGYAPAVDARRVTLRRFITDEYLPYKQSQGLTSVNDYRRLLLGLPPELLDTPLARVGPGHVARLLRDLKERGLADSTVRLRLARLHGVFSHAVRLRVLRDNPCTGFAPAAPAHRVKPMEPEEARRVLDSSVGTPVEVPVALALGCGLRRGEVLGLRWADVDFDAEVLHVRQVVNAEGVVKPPKTQAGVRTVPMPGFVVESLRRHRAAQAQTRLRRGALWREHDLVYPTDLGDPMPVRTFWNRLDAWRTKADVDLRFHDLRHGFATLMGAAGEDLNLLKEMMGHSRVTVTADLYQRVLDTRKRRAANRLDNLIGG